MYCLVCDDKTEACALDYRPAAGMKYGEKKDNCFFPDDNWSQISPLFCRNTKV